MYCTVYEPGKNSERRYEIQRDSSLSIGRDPGNDIIVTAPDVSRIHCYICWNSQRGCFEVVDLSSKGTFDSRGIRLPHGQAFCITEGRELLLGSSGTKIRLYSQGTGMELSPRRRMFQQMPVSYGMGWFKFIVNFSLIAGAIIALFLFILCLAVIIGMFVGIRFVASPQIEVAYYILSIMVGVLPAMGRDLSFIYLLLSTAAIAILMIITRTQLANFRKVGIKWFNVLYAVRMGISIINFVVFVIALCMGAYSVAIYLIPYIFMLFLLIIMWIVDRVYFKKRAYLFT